MLVSTILRPDNRLLAWSTGDLSLYGGQPTTTLAFARPDAGGATDAGRNLQPPEAAPAGQSATGDPLAVPVDHDVDNTPSGGATAPLSASPVIDGAHQTSDEAAATVVIPQSGSTAPYLVAQPTVADHAAPDGSGQPAAVAQDLLGGDALGGHTLAATAPVVGELVGLPNVAAQLGQVDALVHGATDAIGSVAESALDSINGAQAALTDTLGGVDQAVLGVGQALDSVGQTTDAVVQTPVLDIDQIIFSGTDPAGGISTLLDLVQTSELFTIGQADTSATAPDASGSIVDDLIADTALTAPLLGEHAPDAHHDAGIGDLHLGL